VSEQTDSLDTSIRGDPASVAGHSEPPYHSRRQLAISIAAAAASTARVPAVHVTPSTPFALIGLDSAGTIELAAALEDALGLEIPPELVAECPNAWKLAARIGAIRGALQARSLHDDPFERMLLDAVLPADIQPAEASALSRSAGLRSARRLLLTGATGFLGSWLARELLHGSQATVLCLVRRGQDDPRARLWESLARTGIDAVTFADRVVTIAGDLSQPSLGLSPSAFEALGREVDAICHAGATVNWVSPYAALRAANVESTRDLLRLAVRRAVPFHFVSSLSVCYSTMAPALTGEEFDPLPKIRGLHLGYAQTKVVAEALVREAGRRGLLISIYRSSFISGHSQTGAFNHDDIIRRMVSGCVRMRTAPDLDWTLDCLPVEVTARYILRESDRRGAIHLAHGTPRHWRECVLWMRLYGYDVRLVPYHAWLRQLDRETDAAADRSHPLRPLRSFFLNRPPDAHGLSLPELMLEAGRAFRVNARPDPPLDAALLQTYFDAFVTAGALPATAASGGATPAREPDTALFSAALNATVSDAQSLGRLSDHSIVSELTSWRSGRPTGLFRYRLRIDNGPWQGERDVVVKIKPADRDTIAVGEALARLCDEHVGEAYARWAHRIGFTAAHIRELAIYEQRDPRFTSHAPAVLGTVAADGTWTVVLDQITDALLHDSADRPQDWTADSIDCAIRGLSALQAIWYNREAELRALPWIGYVPSATDMAEMTDLWRGLAAHAAPRFSAWADPAIGSLQRRLIDRVERWWPSLDALPRTLIHNDFNPRNICIRPHADGPRLSVYDWELATVGAPQHDLAELLCFVLTSDATDADIDGWIERHRSNSVRETGQSIARREWEQGFRASLYDLMLNRFPMYALVHRVRPQSFLPRTVRTWRRLYQRFPLDA
jgi:thioester reductase-like protein